MSSWCYRGVAGDSIDLTDDEAWFLADGYEFELSVEDDFGGGPRF